MPASSTAAFRPSRPGSASRTSATFMRRTRTCRRRASSWAWRRCARSSRGWASLSGPETIAVSFASPLAEELAEDVLERFLRYARIDTQGAYRVPERPSTQKQLELSRLLVDELRELGLDDARLTEDSNVFASLPGAEGLPAVGLIAHVDT